MTHFVVGLKFCAANTFGITLRGKRLFNLLSYKSTYVRPIAIHFVIHSCELVNIMVYGIMYKYSRTLRIYADYISDLQTLILETFCKFLLHLIHSYGVYVLHPVFRVKSAILLENFLNLNYTVLTKNLYPY